MCSLRVSFPLLLLIFLFFVRLFLIKGNLVKQYIYITTCFLFISTKVQYKLHLLIINANQMSYSMIATEDQKKHKERKGEFRRRQEAAVGFLAATWALSFSTSCSNCKHADSIS
jgi:hypothetical protein